MRCISFRLTVRLHSWRLLRFRFGFMLKPAKTLSSLSCKQPTCTIMPTVWTIPGLMSTLLPAWA